MGGLVRLVHDHFAHAKNFPELKLLLEKAGLRKFQGVAMSAINYNALHAFWLVAEHRSFAAAARQLRWGSAQSLHKRVRQLENEDNLGVVLLRSRGVKGVELTEAGRRLHAFLDPVFKSLEVVVAELRNEDRGPLAVAMSGYIVRNFADEFLSDFRSAFPNVTLKLHVGDAERVISLLQSGHVDLGICPPLPSRSRLVIQSSAAMSLELLVPQAWNCEYVPLTWKKLVETPFVVTARSSMIRQALEHLLRQENLLSELEIAAEVDTLELTVDAVRAGFGIAVVPVGPKVAGNLSGLQRITPPPGLPRIENVILSRKDDYLTRYMREFARIAAEWLDAEEDSPESP